MRKQSKRKREPIVYDPGWIATGTPQGDKPITDIQAHLRGVGVVQPPLRYPNRKPREHAPEITSDVTVRTASGDVYTVKRLSRTRTTRATAKATTVRDAARDYNARLTQFGAIGNID